MSLGCIKSRRIKRNMRKRETFIYNTELSSDKSHMEIKGELQYSGCIIYYQLQPSEPSHLQQPSHGCRLTVGCCTVQMQESTIISKGTSSSSWVFLHTESLFVCPLATQRGPTASTGTVYPPLCPEAVDPNESSSYRPEAVDPTELLLLVDLLRVRRLCEHGRQFRHHH